MICRRQGFPGQRLAVVHGRFLGGGVGRVDDNGPLGAAAVFAAAGRLVALAASIPGIKRGHKGEPSERCIHTADEGDGVIWWFPHWLLKLELLLLADFLQPTVCESDAYFINLYMTSRMDYK